VLLAGPAAQTIWIAGGYHRNRTPDRLWGLFKETAQGQPDLSRAEELARAISYSRTEGNHLVTHLSWRILGRFCAQPKLWRLVSVLAEVLLVHEELPGYQAGWVLLQALHGRSLASILKRLPERLGTAPRSPMANLSQKLTDLMR
jgi:hypothetical protein